MKRVLIVDDHTLFQQGITSLLNGEPDFTVVGGARSVQEAFSQSCLLEPEIVLMDFTLPDGTGLDATRAILAELPATKIVFLTVHEEDELLFQAIRHGARGYLPKNTPIVDLLSYLRGLEKDEAALAPKAVTRILEEFAKTPVREKVDPEILEQFTERQLDVLRALKSGASNKEIAQSLFISEQTVKNHVSRILAILNCQSRHEAARYARRHHL